ADQDHDLALADREVEAVERVERWLAAPLEADADALGDEAGGRPLRPAASSGARTGAIAGWSRTYAPNAASYSARFAGLGSSRRSIRVMPRIAAGTSGGAPGPPAPRAAPPHNGH